MSDYIPEGWDHAPSVFEWLEDELSKYSDQDAADNSMQGTIEMLMETRSRFGGVDLRKALLEAIPAKLIVEWLRYRDCNSVPEVGPSATNREFDRSTMALGILNRALEVMSRDNPLKHELESARVRVYPGYHNTGEILCLPCMDTGIVCAHCRATPCERSCPHKDKVVVNIEMCDQEDCEAANRDRFEIAKYRLALVNQAETIANLRAQVAAQEERIKELEMGVARST